MSANKCTVTIKGEGSFEIEELESGSIAIKKDNILFENTKEGLRECADKIGFEWEPSWNTRQFGSKIINYIQTEKPKEVINREYWINKSTPDNVSLADNLLQIINGFTKGNPYELKYNKEYIGLQQEDGPRNWMCFIPQRQELFIAIKVNRDPKFDAILRDKFNNDFTYSEGSGFYAGYKLHISTSDTEKQGGFFKKLFGKSISNIEALKPILQQAETERLNK